MKKVNKIVEFNTVYQIAHTNHLYVLFKLTLSGHVQNLCYLTKARIFKLKNIFRLPFILKILQLFGKFAT